MRLPIYQVDVFAPRPFTGNPAAVCPLEHWLDDAQLQAIALENNLSETAFYVPDTQGAADFHLRWFTPTVEVALCGHATLAAGYVLMQARGWDRPRLRFQTRSGVLVVERREQALWLDLPATAATPAKAPARLRRAVGGPAPEAVLRAGINWLWVYPDAPTIQALTPDLGALRAQTAGGGLIVTAPGRAGGEDFVSRYFAPALGVDEDPATGSAHAALLPYWAQRLGRPQLRASQLSARGAVLECELRDGRAWLSGPVRSYLRGEISLD
ncbi:MAG: PhzF family phenazine biosynthesis protein [Gammaproteobacteria bacterium]